MMRNFLIKLLASDERHFNGAFLFLRFLAGGMMLVHGWAKITNYADLAGVFPDPLGVGSRVSLLLILGAEVGCSCLVILGFLTRLAVLPLIFGMLMAFFVIHGADPFAVRELPLLYAGIFVALLWAGAGKYSLDETIRRKLAKTVSGK